MSVLPPSEVKVGIHTAVLYTESAGVYANLPGIDAWPLDRDARRYPGPHPVVAHSPCARWCVFWRGRPGRDNFLLGDDGGCFDRALWAVRTFRGLLEHPAHSRAWKWYGLPPPQSTGEWGDEDPFGGRTCAVSQGTYGHVAPKLTWLYAVLAVWPVLDWRVSRVVGRVQNQSRKQRVQTPIEFRDLLLGIVDMCHV